jgi:hypothetical protein
MLASTSRRLHRRATPSSPHQSPPLEPARLILRNLAANLKKGSAIKCDSDSCPPTKPFESNTPITSFFTGPHVGSPFHRARDHPVSNRLGVKLGLAHSTNHRFIHPDPSSDPDSDPPMFNGCHVAPRCRAIPSACPAPLRPSAHTYTSSSAANSYRCTARAAQTLRARCAPPRCESACCAPRAVLCMLPTDEMASPQARRAQFVAPHAHTQRHAAQVTSQR